MVMTQSCSLTTIASFMGMLLSQDPNTVRQRLREWRHDKEDKHGRCRAELDVPSCFAPLLAWIIRLWTDQQLALALDATTLADRFVVLTISVLYRGSALPVAWRIRPSGEKGPWKDDWLTLLSALQPAVPSNFMVLVLADRGLYARWLYQHIVALGWHPCLRINAGAKFRPRSQRRWFWLSELVPARGYAWQGSGTAFISETNRLECTLLAKWDVHQQEPWFLLTDLSPEQAAPEWYGLRMWIENGFKSIKSGAWQWQRTHTTRPERAERVWLALAVATLLTMTLGTGEESPVPPEDGVQGALLRTEPTITAQRRISVLRRGLIKALTATMRNQCWPLLSRLHPDPWPATPP